MACKKCGSSWTTIYGADRASCPECCKLARCKERKAGRYKDPTQSKTCPCCEAQFVAVGLWEISQRDYCSRKCRTRASNKRYSDRSKASSVKPRESSRTCTRIPEPACAMCGQEIKTRNDKKYCSRKCFFDARASGVQQWDRTSIHNAAKTRPSNVAQSPWNYVPMECVSNFLAFVRKLPEVGRPVRLPVQLFDCMICGRLCLNGSRTHCSKGCGSRAMLVGECRSCGKYVMHKAMSSKPRCRKCKRQAYQKKKNRLAGNHRKRCRKNGVPFDPSIKSRDVFARDNYACHVCKRKVLPAFTVRGGVVHPRSPTVDHHPYPLSAGIMGHTWDNVRCACWDCNTKKGAEWSGQLPLRLDAAGPT